MSTYKFSVGDLVDGQSRTETGPKRGTILSRHTEPWTGGERWYKMRVPTLGTVSYYERQLTKVVELTTEEPYATAIAALDAVIAKKVASLEKLRELRKGLITLRDDQTL